MSYWTTSPVVFTVRLVVLLVVHDEVSQREAVVGTYEVDAVLWVASGPPLPPAIVAPPVHQYSYSVRDSGRPCGPVSPLRQLPICCNEVGAATHCHEQPHTLSSPVVVGCLNGVVDVW
jgi:hypothetical protein